MSALLELAERVEAATGPDIQLDADIRDALGLSNDYAAEWRGWGLGADGQPIEKPKAFPYTASIDSALTLVPEGFWHGYQTYDIGFRAHCFEQVVGSPYFGATALTPALALTAASLRARASTGGGQ